MEKDKSLNKIEAARVMDQYVKEIEAARLMKLSVQTLRNWRFQKRGPSYIKIGNRSVRYSMQDIVYFMESQKIQC